MTRVKMCGFTRIDDARAAAEAGVDAIGLVFWRSSPRAVTVEHAAAIVAALPPFVTAVGVFVNEEREMIERISREVGLGAVQLHGDESPSDWREFSRPVLKAVGVGAGFDPADLWSWPARVVPLLDAADSERRGGTGRTIDWALAATVSRMRPVVLAGGLTAATVGQAITAVRPAAVDVSSGVETAPGVKDANLIRAFVRAVRLADGERTR